MTRTLPFLVFITACLPDFPKRDFTEDPTGDYDGDGFTEIDGDCDDNEPLAYPGADEVCDGIDNDCDGDADEDDALDAALWYFDGDRDGYGTESFTINACAAPSENYVSVAGDCDDATVGVNPGSQEFCSERDDDCDGLTDYDDPDIVGLKVWYLNQDGDGFGTDDEATNVEACEGPPGYAYDSGDCDDTNPLVNPSAVEQCDGIDNDCDELTDDDDPGMVGEGTWYADTDGDGFGDAMSDTLEQCAQPDGHVLDATDCDDDNALANPAQTEACNGFDDDCNGETDEDLTIEAFVDADGDGFGSVDSDATDVCEIPEGHSAVATDCDDDNAEINSDGTETCNEADDDCDGVVDDGVTAMYFADTDRDGFGDMAVPVAACAAPEGHVEDWTDCDDTTAASHPDADEICDESDNDCDGVTDEDSIDAPTWYRDIDGDGYSDPDNTAEACAMPEGYTDETLALDCDDTKTGVHPDAVETCFTTYDDDCDADNNDPDATGCTDLYADADDDGYGDASLSACLCTVSDDYPTLDATDCDDTTDLANPGGFETCADDIDNDCDGDTNDDGALGCDIFYKDVDGDGFGLTDDTMCMCEPWSHYAAEEGEDCDDGQPLVNPDAVEVCFDATDNDCDGFTDDETSTDATEWYRDLDEDGFGDLAVPEWACEIPDGYVALNTDCDDARPTVNPDQRESCFTAFDDNCDGSDNDPGDTEDLGPIGGLEHFIDTDGDGFGLSGDSVWSCEDADLYRTRTTGDCDDDNSGANPGTAETCATEFDDDCDGDDNDRGAIDCTALFFDADGDEYGIASSECRCISVGEYTAELAGDCVDTDADINPGTETCGLSGSISSSQANAVISDGGQPRPAGDINGDGFDDLMYRNPDFDVPSDGGVVTNAGAVQIWHGPPPAAVNANLLSGEGGPDASIVGSAAGQQVGNTNSNDRAHSLHGELDGDGYGDLLVAYIQDPAVSTSEVNSVAVFGPLEGIHSVSEWDPMFLDTQNYNYSLGIVPDVTNDGLDEVYRGYNLNFYWSELADEALGGGDLLGGGYYDDAVARSGDWSGDGIADLAVMTRYSTSYLFLHETVSVADSDPDQWAVSRESAVYEALTETGGSPPYQNLIFGHADADGHLDLMVVIGNKSIYDPTLGTLRQAGVTYIILGPLDGYPAGELAEHAETVIRGGYNDKLGSEGMVFSDINGDGLDDPVLSKPSLNESYLFYSPLPSGTLTKADANATFESLTYATDVGDLNGDGRADLVFANTYIFYGQPTE
jgi:hypothetical protein